MKRCHMPDMFFVCHKTTGCYAALRVCYEVSDRKAARRLLVRSCLAFALATRFKADALTTSAIEKQDAGDSSPHGVLCLSHQSLVSILHTDIALMRFLGFGAECSQERHCPRNQQSNYSKTQPTLLP